MSRPEPPAERLDIDVGFLLANGQDRPVLQFVGLGTLQSGPHCCIGPWRSCGVPGDNGQAFA